MSESVSSQEKAALLAKERGLLTEESFQQALAQAELSGSSVLDVAVELELLTPGQVDWLSALADPHSTAPGYELLDVLGRGGMGVVYLARQEKLDREVALKVIHLERLQSPSVLGRTQLEARVTAGLRHPHIVAAFDFGMQDGRAFLAMELVEGEDLDSFLTRVERCDERVAWSIIRQAASALAYAAEQGVVHRDVKPGNMLLTEPIPGVEVGEGVPFVKVVDFGLAFRAEEVDATRLTAAGGTLGTPAYMAPEQLKSTDVDLRADIYSLGATAFHLLAGEAPFEDSTPMDVMIAKTTGNQSWREALPEDVSAASRALVLSMTDYQPANRPVDYHTLLRAIDEVLGKATTSRPDLLATQILTPSQNRALGDRSTLATETVADESISSTVDTPPESSQKLSRRELVVGTLVGVAAAIGAFFGVSSLMNDSSSVAENSKPTAKVIEPGYTLSKDYRVLFNGTDVPFGRGVSPGGSWRPKQTTGYGNVLVGNEGSQLGYDVGLTLGPEFQQSYQLTLLIVVEESEVVEIHLGSAQEAESRIIPAVRITNSFAQLGSVAGRDREFEDYDEASKLPLNPSEEEAQEIRVRIARHQGRWFAEINGESLGSLAKKASPTEKPPEVVTFYVRKGNPLFADMKLVGIEPSQ